MMLQVFDNDDSGMYFIRNNAFRIEKSDVHEKVKSNGIKVVEFIRIIENQLHFNDALVKSLKQAMPRYWMRIWNPVTQVVNHEMAIKQNLIIE